MLTAKYSEGMIFPIEDSMLALEHGGVKEARFFPGAHMGEPGATKTAQAWIDKLVASSTQW